MYVKFIGKFSSLISLLRIFPQKNHKILSKTMHKEQSASHKQAPSAHRMQMWLEFGQKNAACNRYQKEFDGFTAMLVVVDWPFCEDC
jgi:hypothetical protein